MTYDQVTGLKSELDEDGVPICEYCSLSHETEACTILESYSTFMVKKLGWGTGPRIKTRAKRVLWHAMRAELELPSLDDKRLLERYEEVPAGHNMSLARQFACRIRTDESGDSWNDGLSEEEIDAGENFFPPEETDSDDERGAPGAGNDDGEAEEDAGVGAFPKRQLKSILKKERKVKFVDKKKSASGGAAKRRGGNPAAAAPGASPSSAPRSEIDSGIAQTDLEFARKLQAKEDGLQAREQALRVALDEKAAHDLLAREQEVERREKALTRNRKAKKDRGQPRASPLGAQSPPKKRKKLSSKKKGGKTGGKDDDVMKKVFGGAQVGFDDEDELDAADSDVELDYGSPGDMGDTSSDSDSSTPDMTEDSSSEDDDDDDGVLDFLKTSKQRKKLKQAKKAALKHRPGSTEGQDVFCVCGSDWPCKKADAAVILKTTQQLVGGGKKRSHAAQKGTLDLVQSMLDSQQEEVDKKQLEKTFTTPERRWNQVSDKARHQAMAEVGKVNGQAAVKLQRAVDAAEDGTIDVDQAEAVLKLLRGGLKLITRDMQMCVAADVYPEGWRAANLMFDKDTQYWGGKSVSGSAPAALFKQAAKFAAARSKTTTKTRTTGGGGGNGGGNGSGSGGKDKSKVQCHKCKGFGHYKHEAACPQFKKKNK